MSGALRDRCPACGSADLTTAFTRTEWRDAVLQDRRNAWAAMEADPELAFGVFLRCGGCGTFFTDCVPSPDALGRFYSAYRGNSAYLAKLAKKLALETQRLFLVKLLVRGRRFLDIVGNSVMETNPWLLLCSVAAVIGTVRYWKVGSSGSANVALYGSVILAMWASSVATQGTTLGSMYLASSYSAGLGLWTAGVGSLLVGYGGLMMRFPRFGFGLAGGAAAPADEEAMLSTTKTCPKCAEEIKAAATVCRFCHYELEPAAPIR